jgi:hypothetical protein
LSYRVAYHPEARRERDRLPPGERAAIAAAVEKLVSEGPNLRHPHQSNIQGAQDLRELRPRAGRSSWRPLYRRIGPDAFVIAAIAPEAKSDRRRFNRAVETAERRLGQVG